MQNKLPSTYVVSEVELIYRNKVKAADRQKANSSQSAYDILLSLWDMNKIDLVEQFYVLFLDRSSNCLGFTNMFTGGVSSVTVDPKIVFATALKANASGIIIAHNHPSGNLIPGRDDNNVTAKLKEGGKILDIPVVDHLIVTDEGYFSYADQGLKL